MPNTIYAYAFTDAIADYQIDALSGGHIAANEPGLGDYALIALAEIEATVLGHDREPLTDAEIWTIAETAGAATDRVFVRSGSVAADPDPEFPQPGLAVYLKAAVR